METASRRSTYRLPGHEGEAGNNTYAIAIFC